MNYRKVFLSFVATIFWLSAALAQQVPYGIKYQAVARDSYGDEMASRQIDIRFSIRSGTDQGNLEYQEVHAGILTSAFGVFELVIGSGTPVGGDKETFSDITWELDDYYLGVEIKFGSDFLNMGTMKFLSVPYALYAGRSLEPGPVGPPGPAGDPATDDQTLSFDGSNLEILGGNTVNLTALINNPDDEIQYLSIAGDSLSITNGNSIKLEEIIDDADADPTNEIQTLSFNSVNSGLTITDGNTVDLTPLVNTDMQQLSYNPVTHVLTITNGSNSIDLDDLKNDADASVTNELISSMNIVGSQLVIDEGSTQHSVDLSSNMVAFRVKKLNTTSAPMPLSSIDFIPDFEEYNVDNHLNFSNGEFTVPFNGVYTFYIYYSADGPGGSRELMLFINGNLYETLGTEISSGDKIYRTITLKLDATNKVKLVIFTGSNTSIGTGIFSGFRVF
jgi:hypothetical protein